MSEFIERSKHPQGTQAVQSHFGMEASVVPGVSVPTQAPLGNGLANQARQTVVNRGSQLNKQIEDAGG